PTPDSTRPKARGVVMQEPSETPTTTTTIPIPSKVQDKGKDKIAQAIEITNFKQSVKRLEKKRKFKTSGLKRLRKGGIAELDANEDVTLEAVNAEVTIDADVQGRLPESQAKVYHLDLEHAEKVLNMQDTDEAEPAEVEEVIKVVTATKLITKVVTTATNPITAAQVPKASAPRRRRGSKRKDASPEQKATKKQMIDEEEEELKRHLQIVVNDDNDVFTEATPLALNVPVVDYQIYYENNKPFYKIIRADGTHM
nr:hypothetical protein [Tanacetum cinerariifolium]